MQRIISEGRLSPSLSVGSRAEAEAGPLGVVWLPGQVSSYLKTPRLRELCAAMQEPIPDLIAPAVVSL
jgi:hypothetical protein